MRTTTRPSSTRCSKSIPTWPPSKWRPSTCTRRTRHRTHHTHTPHAPFMQTHRTHTHALHTHAQVPSGALQPGFDYGVGGDDRAGPAEVGRLPRPRHHAAAREGRRMRRARCPRRIPTPRRRTNHPRVSCRVICRVSCVVGLMMGGWLRITGNDERRLCVEPVSRDEAMCVAFRVVVSLSPRDCDEMKTCDVEWSGSRLWWW